MMKKSILSSAILLALGTTASHAASLNNGDTLIIELGNTGCNTLTQAGTGSCFSMGAGGYGFVPIEGEFNLVIGPDGTGDMGTGSHGGSPATSDVGSVTAPWDFFYNTGYDYVSEGGGTTGITTGGITGDTTSGLDFTPWTVTWNGIAAIPMGGCSLGDPANNEGFSGCDQNKDGVDDFTDSGVASFSWDGIYGNPFTLSYTATVPVGDPSNFGGVQYDLLLRGTVQAVPVPAAVWLFGSGILGLVGVARRKKSG